MLCPGAGFSQGLVSKGFANYQLLNYEASLNAIAVITAPSNPHGARYVPMRSMFRKAFKIAAVAVLALILAALADVTAASYLYRPGADAGEDLYFKRPGHRGIRPRI